MNDRISELSELIRQLQEQERPFHEKVINEYDGDYNKLSEEERTVLDRVHAKLKALRAEIGPLKRDLMTKEEKRKAREIGIALSLKFSDEGNNALASGYYQLYLMLLDKLETVLSEAPDLREIYEYLDATDFQRVIPDHYLAALEQVELLDDIVAKIRVALKML